jgi:undecaprenyl pyrophosphate synthase
MASIAPALILAERLAQPRCVFREIRLEHQIAAAYGGREEIVDAVQRLLREQALKTR